MKVASLKGIRALISPIDVTEPKNKAKQSSEFNE